MSFQGIRSLYMLFLRDFAHLCSNTNNAQFRRNKWEEVLFMLNKSYSPEYRIAFIDFEPGAYSTHRSGH